MSCSLIRTIDEDLEIDYVYRPCTICGQARATALNVSFVGAGEDDLSQVSELGYECTLIKAHSVAESSASSTEEEILLKNLEEQSDNMNSTPPNAHNSKAKEALSEKVRNAVHKDL